MTEHKAVIMGQIYREHFSYRSHWIYIPEIEKGTVLDRFEKFWEGNIYTDKIIVGDCIYIKELDMRVEVLNRVISTDGLVTYETDHFIRTEKNQKTEDSYKVAQLMKKRTEEFNEAEIEGKNKWNEELEEERESAYNKSKKSWFERIFG